MTAGSFRMEWPTRASMLAGRGRSRSVRKSKRDDSRDRRWKFETNEEMLGEGKGGEPPSAMSPLSGDAGAGRQAWALTKFEKSLEGFVAFNAVNIC